MFFFLIARTYKIRPGESATTRRAAIDKRVWTIQPKRMHVYRPHTTLLLEREISLLETHKPYSGHRADRNLRTHANSQTSNMALKRA